MKANTVNGEDLLDARIGGVRSFPYGTRTIAADSDGIGALRRILVATLGGDRAKGLLVRFGWSRGYDGALGLGAHSFPSASREWLAVANALQTMKRMAGPSVKSLRDCNGVKGESLRIRLTDSYEAEQHLHFLGANDSPVCWSLIGFAGGYATALFGEKILFVETECIGKGDAYCEIVGKPLSEWGKAIEPELAYYQDRGLEEEIDTCRRMREQYAYLERRFDLHRQLTDHVLNGEGIEGITQTVSRFVNGIVFVWDSHLYILRYDSPDNGRPLDQIRRSVLGHLEGILLYQRNPEDYSTLVGRKMPLKYGFRIDSERFSGLAAPIVAGGDVLGFVSVVWDCGREVDADAIVAVQSAANVCALEMIKQKEISSIEQQFRWDFVEALFSNKYASEESLIAWGLRLGHDIRKPHRIVAMAVEYPDAPGVKSEEEAFLLRKEILRAANMYLKKLYPSVFSADVKGRIILFLPEVTPDKKVIRRIIAELKDKIEHHFPKTSISFGVGGIAHRCDDYFNHYLQAKKAHIILKAYRKKDWVVFFEDLGSLSVLLDADNKQDLLEFMRRKLGPLLDYDQKHKSELVKSLEDYLSTSSLRKTSRMTSISLSGLKYRLNKIKEFGYDLQSPQERFDLHLALQILRITQ